MLKFLVLFDIVVAPYASASAQSFFQPEQGTTHADNRYRYKLIGFQNLVVQVADAPPVRYGVRQFATLSIIVLNRDKQRRVEIDSNRIFCDCGGRKTLSALPFRKITLPGRQIFAGNSVFLRNSYKGIVLLDGTCGTGDTRLVTIRLGNVAFHYLLQVTRSNTPVAPVFGRSPAY